MEFQTCLSTVYKRQVLLTVRDFELRQNFYVTVILWWLIVELQSTQNAINLLMARGVQIIVGNIFPQAMEIDYYFEVIHAAERTNFSSCCDSSERSHVTDAPEKSLNLDAVRYYWFNRCTYKTPPIGKMPCIVGQMISLAIAAPPNAHRANDRRNEKIFPWMLCWLKS